MVSVDDTVRPGVTLESLSKLKPVFMEDGSSTAGNSSGVGDGAALCILTTRSRAEKEGWDIVGKFVASAFVGESVRMLTDRSSELMTDAGVEPRYMGISPTAAIPKVLAMAGISKEDIDVWEVSSLFSFSCGSGHS